PVAVLLDRELEQRLVEVAGRVLDRLSDAGQAPGTAEDLHQPLGLEVRDDGAGRVLLPHRGLRLVGGEQLPLVALPEQDREVGSGERLGDVGLRVEVTVQGAVEQAVRLADLLEVGGHHGLRSQAPAWMILTGMVPSPAWVARAAPNTGS